MMEQQPQQHKTLGMHVRRALREARAWRPVSFYMLLATPLVLALGVHMIQLRDNPLRFAFVLTLLFLFFGIVVLRAILDMFEIGRRNLRAQRDTWTETIGHPQFIGALKERRPPESSL